MIAATTQRSAHRSLIGMLVSVTLHAALLFGFSHAIRTMSSTQNAEHFHTSAPIQVVLLRIQAIHPDTPDVQALGNKEHLATDHTTAVSAINYRTHMAVGASASKPTIASDSTKAMHADTTPENAAPMASTSLADENFKKADAALGQHGTPAPESSAVLELTQSARPDYAYNPAPDYPMLLREHGIGGTVWLRVWVDSDGRPTDVKVAKGSGYRLLDEAALRAVGQWRFIPAKTGNQKLASWVEFPIRFTLNG